MLLAMVKSILGKRAEETPLVERADEELMLLYAEGEPRAFEILLARYERPIFNFILRSCRRRDIAEEMTQEVFLRVIRNASGYQERAKFSTWLFTIARNLCIDRARKSSKRRELSLDEPIGSADEGGATFADRLVDESAAVGHMSHEREVFLGRLQGALDQLPEEQREVFLLKEVSGLKFREIADLVDAPVPTVKSRMRYALQALRGYLSEYEEVRFDEDERREVVRSSE